jgi:hypothetical protein
LFLALFLPNIAPFTLQITLSLSNYMSHVGAREWCRRGQGVANFVNLIHFGPSTFHLLSWAIFWALFMCIPLYFGYFYTFSSFLIFFVGSKIGNNKCPLFIMFTKQNFIKVLHSKEKVYVQLVGWSTHPKNLLLKFKN